MRPKQRDHGTAGGYTITTRIPPEHLSPLSEQEYTPKEMDSAGGDFSLHADLKRDRKSGLANEYGESGHRPVKTGQPCLSHQSAYKGSSVYERRITRAVSQAISNTAALNRSKGAQSNDTQDRPPSQKASTPDSPSASSVSHSPHPSIATITGTPSLLLINADLWSKFHEHVNEMIITKSGRCLFPCLRFRAVGLNPEAIYSICLDFERLDDQRYRFSGGAWKPVQTARRAVDDLGDKHTSILAQESYMHPDLFRTGRHWMKAPISFSKVKLTNSIPNSILKSSSKRNGPSNNSHVFHVASFYKYRPRVHLAQRSRQSHSVVYSSTYTFDTTTFIAVTHYQNNRVNDLKKDFNPHARGFRDTVVNTEPPVGPSSRSSYLAPSTRKLRTRKRLCLNRQSTESESDVADLVYDNKDEWEAEENETESDEEGPHSRDSNGSSVNDTNRLCRLDRTNKAMVKISFGKSGLTEGKASRSEPPLQPNGQSLLNAPRLSDCLPPQLLQSKITRKSALQDSRPRIPLSSFSEHQVPKLRQSRSSIVGVVSKAHERRTEQLREDQGHSISVLNRVSASSANTQVGTTYNTLFPFTGNVLTNSPSLLQSDLFAERTSPFIPNVGQSSLGNSILTGPDAAALPITPSPLPSSLSWYQQFSLWEQPPSDPPHQRNAPLPSNAPAPGLSDAPLSVQLAPTQDSQQKLMQDSATPMPLQHMATVYSAQPQVFSEPFVDVEGDIVPGTPVLDTHLLPIAHSFRQDIQSAAASVGGATEGECGLALTRPHTLMTTILESKTEMSMSPAIAVSSQPDYSEQTSLELAVRDNLRLKAFIRERYGLKAEAEANAVIAMERLQ
ncbi:hypothetical protein BGZ50_009868 [Haplosporangium sp. Z 11]|nr:hypothetical protein BGZ50_009868 [Haplosporangium sp. Z 11]